MKICMIAFTQRGIQLAAKISQALDDCTLSDSEKEAASRGLSTTFSISDGIVFVGAIGLVVRLIAPLLRSKTTDPAVVVLDEAGEFVIPILSGHIGGANALARRIGAAIGATPVITTATDVNGLFAVDEWAVNAGCRIVDASKIKHISAAVLRYETVGFYSEFETEGELPIELTLQDSGEVGVCVSLNERRKPFGKTLNLVPKILALGVGCRKNIPPEVFESFILETLAEKNISLKAVKSLATIDIKREEECILQFAKKYSLALEAFSAAQLREVEGDFSPSDFVKETTGVDNVCERSAALACSKAGGGQLLMGKTVQNGMTMAVSILDWRCVF